MRKRINKLICLLISVGILCIFTSSTAYAWNLDTEEVETTEETTMIEPPGSAETPEELNKLNIADTVTISYDNGNGEINGALRILLTLTLIMIAPTLIIMLTSFTRIIIVLHFKKYVIFNLIQI